MLRLNSRISPQEILAVVKHPRTRLSKQNLILGLYPDLIRVYNWEN